MRTQRILSALLAALMLISALSGCGKKAVLAPVGSSANEEAAKPVNVNACLLQKAVELTERAGRLAGEVGELYTSEAEVLQYVSEISKGDYSLPARSLLVELRPELTKMITAALNIPNELSETVRVKMLPGISNMLASQFGANAIAASSICRTGESFIKPFELNNDALLLLIYDDYVSAVTFVNRDDGIVSVSAQFAPVGDTADYTADDITAYIGNLGYAGDDLSEEQLAGMLGVSVFEAVDVDALMKETVPDTVSQPQKSKISIDAFMLQMAEKLTGEMAELAQNKSYAALMGVSADLTDIVDKMSAADFGEPETAIIVKLPESAAGDVIASLTGEDVCAGLSAEACEQLAEGALTSLPSRLNATFGGTSVLAAASIFSISVPYKAPDNFADNAMVILFYGGEYASTVTFAGNGNGTVTAGANFVLVSELLENMGSEDELLKMLEEGLGLKGAQCSLYSADEARSLLAE